MPMRRRALGACLILIAFSAGLLISWPRAIASGIASVAAVFGQTGAVNIPVTTTDIATPGAPAAGKTAWYTKSGTLCAEAPGGTETCTGGGGGPSANQNIRSIGAGFDGGGSALTAGKTVYVTAPFTCTIAAWNITVDTGTATVDVWKIATGTAIPTVANTITASATPAISSGTAIHSTTLTGWTTAVTANDIFGFNLKAVASATELSIVVQCNATT